MPQRTELYESHHLPVTPEVRFKTSWIRLGTKKSSLLGAHQPGGFRDEAARPCCAVPGQAVRWGRVSARTAARRAPRCTAQCEWYLPRGERGGGEVLSLVETSRDVARSEECSPPHAQPDVAYLRPTCPAQPLAAEHESIARQDGAVTNTSIPQH